jgi:putative membrane-bound dehydrogenase-like protein
MKRFLGISVLIGMLVSQVNAQAPAPAKPLSPQEALKKFQLAKGLKIELVACEPQIESPVFMAFDQLGKLWVVEMRDYPNGPAPGKPPEGRIRILQDKDGDGFFETSSIFGDQLLFANGLLHWKDGVIVTAAPHIAWLRDTDGDGKMDTKEILFEGFSTQNPQLRVSHPILGLDGWIYVANGLRGGQIVSAKPQAKKEPVNLSGMDFRFDMLTGQYEAISGMGQFGNTFDDWGNRFVCDNRHHLRHVVIENRYLKRNPYLAVAGVVEDISELRDGPLNSGGKIFPLSKNWTTSNLHEGRFTAACGVHIYRGDLLPEPFRGAAFTCDPTGNLVHGETMKQKGATFESHPFQKGVEFLASPDDWFRPVSLSTGPDGALYVVDMYRAVIEHPEFMPPELKNRPDLVLGKDKGRIWRIVPQDRPKVKSLGSDPLAMLHHPNAFWRTLGQRLILEKNLRVKKDDISWGEPETRIHQAWVLDRQGLLREKEVVNLLQDPHPRVREQALILAEKFTKSPEVVNSILTNLPKEKDPRVRFQGALSLGQMENKGIVPVLAEIAFTGSEDKWTRIAVASSVPQQAGQVLEYLLKFQASFRPEDAVLLQELASLVGARQDPMEVEKVLVTLREMTGDTTYRWQSAGLNGLAEGLGRRGAQLGNFLKTLPSIQKDPTAPLIIWWEKFLEKTASLAGNSQGETGERVQAIRLLPHASWVLLEKTLDPLTSGDTNQEVQLAAVRALAIRPEKEVAPLLMKSWRTYSPSLRREVTEAMLRQPGRIHFLLDEVEKKNVKPGDIDVMRTRQLLKHAQAAIRERAQKLLQENIPADRKVVMTRYQEALKVKGDSRQGQVVFKKNCATCHKVAGMGIDVGPDISDTRTKTIEGLLADILNPNQAIDNNYVNYLVTTKSGKSLTGILAGETSTSITLKRAEGQMDVLLRQEIEEIQSTGVSLMPEAMEKNITIAEMADLLAFLKNWRYLDGTVPLGN